MSSEFLVITGATGNVGGGISRILLEQGRKVRVIGRREDRLKPLADLGAESRAGSLDDVEAMTRAFTGATAVFTMIPPSPVETDFRAYQNRVSDALATALDRAGVGHVVNLSSIGAQHPSGTGPIAGLHDQEVRFSSLSAASVLHVRAGFFMENHLMSIGLIRQLGMNGSPLRGDLLMPQIATRDIAAFAARRLVERDFQGRSVHELLGRRDHSMTEVTRVLGAAIGRPDLQYVQFSYADAEKALLGAGLSADVARLYIEMQRGMNEGRVAAVGPRTRDNTTPTSIEDFAATFAAAYHAG